MKEYKETITILTLNGYTNYGNRLQLFALSRTLARLSIRTKTYWRKKPIFIAKSYIKRFPIIRKKFLKEQKLRDFSKKYTPREVSKLSRRTVVGSDQVWNVKHLDKRQYLLNMQPVEKQRFSYAASVSVAELKSDEKQVFKDALRNYSLISVREQSAKDLLQPLTDKKIEVVLDPTLLLMAEEYEQLEKKPKGLAENERYILCYILGNRDHEEKIEKFAKEKGYKTIYFSDKCDSDYGVEEFLYLIHHAQLICTDSFHACVFSFIFERPFVAFKRTGEANYMYTRLQNLIDTFELKNREFNGKEITKENLEVNYTEAKKILKKEQKKSLDFLKRALDIKDEN